MTIRDIQPSVPITECDLCGRTLLVGEQALGYVDAGVHHSVCELCTGRAREAGWIREDGPVTWVAEEGEPQRPSLWRRLRPGRPQPRPGSGPGSGSGGAPGPGSGGEPGGEPETPADAEPEGLLSVAPVRSRPGAAEASAPASHPSGGPTPEGHGPRTLWRWRPVRSPAPETPGPAEAATPATPVAAAVAAFNASDHPRTLTGVARSLGRPGVAVQETADRPGVVRVVVFWELCWYRYDVDVSGREVRIAGQGYQLSELSEAERQANATADASGHITLAG